MIGKYRLKQNEQVIAEANNIITVEGRKAILRYLAGDIAEWAGAIVLGVSDVPATMGDKRLVFEADRAPIVLRVADIQNDTIVFRATFGTGVIGKIYELGITTGAYSDDELGSSRIITDFNPDFQEIEGGIVDVNNYRLSNKSLSLLVPATMTRIVTLPSFYQDFSVYQDSDTFALAYELFDANASSITVRFLVNGTNYFEHTFVPSNVAGYYVTEWQLAACTAVGAPAWGEIGSINVIATAGAADTIVNLDGLRINDTAASEDNVLVSRAVLTTPNKKIIDQELEVEYEVAMGW